MSTPGGGAVVVLPPVPHDPDDMLALREAATGAHRTVSVGARPSPAGRWSRRSDLALDILDGLARVGTTRGQRKFGEQNLTFLVPFLLTGPVDELLVTSSQWLRLIGIEDLLAACELAGVRLWLSCDLDVSSKIARLLAYQDADQTTVAQASAYFAGLPRWRDRPLCSTDDGGLPGCCLGCIEAAVKRVVNSPGYDGESARLSVAERLRSGLLTAELAADVSEALGRDTARTAARVLTRHGWTDPDQLAGIRVADVRDDGSVAGLHLSDSERGTLLRQRLHAQLWGYTHAGPLFVLDGATMNGAAVFGLLRGVS